jgi:hypothetical protein
MRYGTAALALLAALLTGPSLPMAPAAQRAPATAVAATTVDPDAPVGATVPGLTGSAARDAVGDAGTDFGDLQHQAAAGTFHGNFGVVVPTATLVGAMATQSVDANLRVFHAGEFVYAPTLLPGTGACIELTTIYDGGAAQVGAWDWCAAAPSFVKVATIDATFLSTYTAMVHGRPAYSMKTVLTNASNNTWTAYLYNQTTAKWDVFDSESGTASSDTANGWDMFEVYTITDPNSGNGYYCADSRGVTWESSGVAWSFTSGVWQKPIPSNSSWIPNTTPSPVDFRCPTLTFTIVSANDDFTVSNSAAPTGPITGIAGKCVDVYQNKSVNGTHVDIFTCNGHKSQSWTVPGDGTLRALGMCLDVTNSGTADRSLVQLWSCSGTGAQRWKYSASTKELVNPESGKCLDDPKSSTVDNTQLEIFTCNGKANQQWKLPA